MADPKAAILAFAKPREEAVSFAGVSLTVRELQTAADLVPFRDGKDGQYKLFVRCVYGPDGALVFGDDDIDEIKALSNGKMLPLIQAVDRVNGLDLGAEVKNSDGGTGAG